MHDNIIGNVLTDEVLARFDLDIEEATGLPNACYTSAEWLEAENERVFARTWMLAGFCRDIPDKGDACPVEVAGMPLLILRDNDGEVRVFHNVCRHRGAVVVPERCSGRRDADLPLSRVGLWPGRFAAIEAALFRRRTTRQQSRS